MRAAYLAAVWLHVLAAMAWIGGMVVFVIAVMPYFRGRPEAEKAQFLEWFGQRFRVVSWTCIAILAATGPFNLWVRGVRPEDFLRPEWRSTAFGQMVIVKLSLVAVMIAVSSAHERLGNGRYAKSTGRALLLLGLGVVGAAVMMVRAL
jgi:copper resistance protein D